MGSGSLMRAKMPGRVGTREQVRLQQHYPFACSHHLSPGEASYNQQSRKAVQVPNKGAGAPPHFELVLLRASSSTPV